VKAVYSESHSSSPTKLEEYIDAVISVLIHICLIKNISRESGRTLAYVCLFKIISRGLGRALPVKIMFVDTLTLGFMLKIKT
jgi:hypothetical protein